MNSQHEEDDLEKLKFYMNATFDFCDNILFSDLVHKPSLYELSEMSQKIGKNEIERLYNHFHLSAITDNVIRQKQYCIELWSQWRSYFNEHMPEKQIIIEIVDQIAEVIIYVYEN